MLVKLLENTGISAFEWLEKIYCNEEVLKFNELVQQYVDETTDELWESKDGLMKFAGDRDNIRKYISGDYGNNLLAKYKALSLTEYLEHCCEVASLSIRSLLEEHDTVNMDLLEVADEIIKFKYFL